jgi:hypothetical protein
MGSQLAADMQIIAPVLVEEAYIATILPSASRIVFSNIMRLMKTNKAGQFTAVEAVVLIPRL